MICLRAGTLEEEQTIKMSVFIIRFCSYVTKKLTFSRITEIYYKKESHKNFSVYDVVIFR